MTQVILCDTREKENQAIINYFKKNHVGFIEKKLDAGDYMLMGDPTTIIDRKDSLLEMCKNLTGRKGEEHKRLVREVDRAHEAGCKTFIFLIAATKIKTTDDIKAWRSPYTQVPGHRLLKIMETFADHHDCKFMFVPKRNMGKKIVEILMKK